jgi:hypothetical protein
MFVSLVLLLLSASQKTLFQSPHLLPSTDPPSPPFFGWKELLQQRTRTGGVKFEEIPSFVSFCAHHRDVARRSSGSSSKDKEGSDFLFHQLQGGAAAGPLAKRSGDQVVRAASFYPDLTASSRHENRSFPFRYDTLEWVNELEQHLPTFQAELASVLAAHNNTTNLPWQSLRTRKGEDWSDTTGWAHLAAIDNFRVNEEIVQLFPKTMGVVEELASSRVGPRLVAIARQSAGTGIPKHYDYMNCMLTVHMGIFGPAFGSGMVVAGDAQDWCVGKAVVMDTTFSHSTYNRADSDMYLLLVDVWHPDLHPDEQDALRAFLAANSGV